ncbi:MAG: class I SAM-dependent methyltransferase [Actinomycetota bacterium]|nr:class I SAM-dependent methyltransferase [Actinomycetota bacterium]
MTSLVALPVGWVQEGGWLVLRAESGQVLTMDTDRWHGAASTEERAVLDVVDAPVIDVGCGPGRLLESLARRGVPAMGVDSSPAAVALARRRGAAVLQRDVFGRLPGEGRWATALLFDGNIGIGGDPTRLLARCRQLTGGRGRVIAEVGPPGTGWRALTAWLERDGYRSPSFAWALVGADAVGGLAQAAGLRLILLAATSSGRRFAHLVAA